MERLFGTDGIRGLANVEPVSPRTALSLGQALGTIALRRGGEVVLGRDTRRSGPMLEAALVAGLCSAGASVRLLGVVPTPAVAEATVRRKAAAGLVVSASHNPFPDNGIKLFGPDGFKLSDREEDEITAVVRGATPFEGPTGAAVGAVQSDESAVDRYVEAIAASIDDRDSLRGMRLVIDAANGAASPVCERLVGVLGLQATILAAAPSGTNINVDCGALHPAALLAHVKESGADLGIAVDGDADRVLLSDERGGAADGDDVLAVLAADLHSRQRMTAPVVVGTVMSNLGLDLYLRTIGVRLARTAVGDRYVVEEMQRSQCQLGGEPSGHVIQLDHGTTGDGLMAGLQVAAILARTGKPLSELRAVLQKCPQSLVNVRVARKVDLAELPRVQSAIAAAEAAMHGRGRVLVRYSGTEPLVRVMVEGESESDVARWANEIAGAVGESIQPTSE